MENVLIATEWKIQVEERKSGYNETEMQSIFTVIAKDYQEAKQKIRDMYPRQHRHYLTYTLLEAHDTIIKWRGE